MQTISGFARQRRQKGFTMIELLVVLAILGIIVAIALPSYRASIRKSQRTDAHISLSRLATLQERFYFRTNNYTDDFADLIGGATSGSPVDSDEGHYSISLSANAGGTVWTMVATAVGDQAQDTECAKLTLTSLGAKTSVNSANTASQDCW